MRIAKHLIRDNMLVVIVFLLSIFPLSLLDEGLASVCPCNTQAGDFNGDKEVDLADLVLALQVQSSSGSPIVTTKGDVDGDGKIGMRDALFSFQIAGGIRPAPPNILFAHGMNSEASHWEAYATVARLAGWNVFCTDVTPDGSIAVRAAELATFIDSLKLEPDSLIAVGHSMGGLDLRHVITEGHDTPGSVFAEAAAVIHEVYTIATPHKGHPAGGFPLSDAIADLGLGNMLDYNSVHPYSKHMINGREIPLTALRFACQAGEENGDDGLVAVPSQSLRGAPHTVQVFPGSHTPDYCSETGAVTELVQVSEILVPILNGTGFETDAFDIVFFEGNDCTDGEKGSFSSRIEMVRDCSDSDIVPSHLFNLGRNYQCDNDEIRSVKVYPGIEPNTRIRVYDAAAESRVRFSDDWTAINLGDQEFDEAVCIPTYEQQGSTALENMGITMYFHQGPEVFVDSRLDGKISRVSISDNSLNTVFFYEGDNCTQGVKASFSDFPVYEDCTASSANCDNDEIRSILISPGVEDETIIKTYDSSDGSLSDDWFFVNRGSQSLSVPFCINGMEHSTSSREDAEGISTYYRENNGLNGKVSYLKISQTKDSKFVFYEGLNCSQQVKGLFEVGSSTDDYAEECTGYSGNGTCDNDEIQSVLIQPGVLKGKDFRVYDDQNGTLGDDYTSVYRGWQTFNAPFCINGFEHDTSSREADAGITVNYHPDNGLNGKISFIKVIDGL